MKPSLIITVTNNISYDQRMDRIATSLSKEYEVTIIGTKTRNPPPLVQKTFKQRRLGTFFSKSKYFYLEYNLRLFFYLLFKRIDVVYAVDLDTILASHYAKKIRKFKLVFDSHEFFTELPELENRIRTKKIWKKIGKISINSADLAITVNAELAKILSEKYKRKFFSIMNVPHEQKLTNQTKVKRSIIYQGAINQGRGLESLILSMKKLEDHILWIVGDGPLRNSLEQLCEEKQISNVDFKGMLSGRNLRDLTQQAEVGVNLLDSSSLNYYYSLANKFFDYSTAHVPSINMNFPVYASLNKELEVSVLIDDLEVESVVDAIKSLESSKALYQELQENCRKASKKWNWASEEQKFLELMKML